MAKRNGDMRRWALAGAERRLLEIAAEAAAIHRAFPELRQGGRRPREIPFPRGAKEPATQGRKRRRRKMSDAQRKAIAKRMRSYWKGRRAANEKKKA